MGCSLYITRECDEYFFYLMPLKFTEMVLSCGGKISLHIDREKHSLNNARYETDGFTVFGMVLHPMQ